MSALNVNQIRHVQSTFAHVDSLLQAAERVARADLSPFARERADFAPSEAALFQASIALARERMLLALDRLGLPRPMASASAKWAAQTSLIFADSALSELGAADLKGYGAVDDEAARELEALAADVRGIIERARAQLHESDASGFIEQLATIPGPAGEILRTVELVSRTHALAEIRPLLGAAAERATSTSFDVGVFGRVSAGKSSLIDALIGVAVLPVGATPVTAVPVRLVRGAERVTLWLLDGSAREITLSELPQYATEDGNPDNRAGIRSIDIAVPSVPEGLRLLDTPGVGSMRASGAAQAFAWLPRCDLGLVLVASSSPVGHDELALAAGLRHAGIRCVVLISKADLLTASDLDRMLAYVRREFANAAGLPSSDANGASDIEVHAVSSIAEHRAALEAFRVDELLPLARDHARSAQRALSMRLRQLVYATASGLSNRREGKAAPVAAEGAVRELDDTLRMQRARTSALRQLRDSADEISTQAPSVLETAITAVVEAWREDVSADEAVRTSLLQSTGAMLGDFRRVIDGVSGVAGVAAQARRRAPPIFDLALLEGLPSLVAPGMAGRLMAHTVATRRLQPLAEPFTSAMQRYSTALYAWAEASLNDIAAMSPESPDEPHENRPASTAPGLPPELAALQQALVQLDNAVETS